MLPLAPSALTSCSRYLVTDALSHPLRDDTVGRALADFAPPPKAAASPLDRCFFGLVLLPLKLKSFASSSSSVSASSAQLVTGDFLRSGDLKAATTLLDSPPAGAIAVLLSSTDATESTTESTMAVTAALVLGEDGVFPFFFLVALLPQAALAAGFSFFSRTGLFAVLATVAAHEKGAGALDVLVAVVEVEVDADFVLLESLALGPAEALAASPLACTRADPALPEAEEEEPLPFFFLLLEEAPASSAEAAADGRGFICRSLEEVGFCFTAAEADHNDVAADFTSAGALPLFPPREGNMDVLVTFGTTGATLGAASAATAAAAAAAAFLPFLSEEPPLLPLLLLLLALLLLLLLLFLLVVLFPLEFLFPPKVLLL